MCSKERTIQHFLEPKNSSRPLKGSGEKVESFPSEVRGRDDRERGRSCAWEPGLVERGWRRRSQRQRFREEKGKGVLVKWDKSAKKKGPTKELPSKGIDARDTRREEKNSKDQFNATREKGGGAGAEDKGTRRCALSTGGPKKRKRRVILLQKGLTENR